jgi:hypothetical protein
MRVSELLIAGIVSGAVASGAVLLFADSHAAAPADMPSAAELMRELQQLSREIAVMRDVPPTASAPVDASGQIPSQLLDPRLDSVIGRLGALDEQQQALLGLLTQLSMDVKELSAQLSASKPGEPMPEKLPDGPPDIAKISLLLGKSMTELSEAFNFWDYDRVLADYGRPNRIAPTADGVGVNLIYEIPDGDALIFIFKNGKCFRAYFRNQGR